jgi:DNA gyrase subunit B
LYLAAPPLYKIEVGSEKIWAIDDQDKEDKLAELEKTGRPIKNVQRFKGLGEMTPEQLWDTTMNPETRVVKKITIEDAEEANKVFEMLMGEEVAPRRHFIQANAKEAEIDT